MDSCLLQGHELKEKNKQTRQGFELESLILFSTPPVNEEQTGKTYLKEN